MTKTIRWNEPMLSKAEFNRRVFDNSMHFRKTYRKSADPAKYHFYDARAGEVTPMRLLDKVYDIFGAAAIGALPLLSSTGADAMWMDGTGDIVPIELKFCKINSDRYTMGPQGGIYLKDRNQRVTLAGSIKGQWVVNSLEHLKTKKRYTILVVYDITTDMFVAARGLSGSIVVDCLGRSGKLGGKMITWNTFMEHGREIPLVPEEMGYENLIHLIQENNVAA